MQTEALEQKVEQPKSFTEIIREKFRKNVLYIALAALSICGGCGATPTEIYIPQYTQEYTRPIPTEFVAADGTRIYREEKVKLNKEHARDKLIYALQTDCSRVSHSDDLIICYDYGCLSREPEICSKGKWGDGSCRPGKCLEEGYYERWTLPLKGISSLSVEVGTDSGEITIRKGQKGWPQEEKVLSFEKADVCKETADILYTFFQNN